MCIITVKSLTNFERQQTIFSPFAINVYVFHCDWFVWVGISASMGRGPGPMPFLAPMVISDQWIKNLAKSVSQPIRDESDDITSGWAYYLMQDITTTPKPLCLLLFKNLLRNMGLTTVKAVLCLDLDKQALAYYPSKLD